MGKISKHSTKTVITKRNNDKCEHMEIIINSMRTNPYPKKVNHEQVGWNCKALHKGLKLPVSKKKKKTFDFEVI